jgi:hypothetical protein
VQRILIDGAGAVPVDDHGIESHLENCRECAAVAATQQRLDAKLTAALTPPVLSVSFRAALDRQIGKPSTSFATDALPDVLHLAGCALVTALCAFAVPTGTSTIVASGTLATVASYVLLTVMRNTLDESRL